MKDYMYNKDGQAMSMQISTLKAVNAGNTNFGRGVLIKNITNENIKVSIKPVGQPETVDTILYPGWNVELVEMIYSVPVNSLQYGY